VRHEQQNLASENDLGNN